MKSLNRTMMFDLIIKTVTDNHPITFNALYKIVKSDIMPHEVRGIINSLQETKKVRVDDEIITLF